MARSSLSIRRAVRLFKRFRHRATHPGHAIAFYAFDLLHLAGKDLTGAPLQERRAGLPEVLNHSGILMSTELPGTPAQVIAAVQSLGLEGVIAKRRTSPYTPGEHHTAWVKLKLDKQQEFVVGGYRPGPNGVDALLVGFYDGKDLRFAGKVRAGFTPHVRREVFAQLKPLHLDRCPFVDLPNSKTSHWGGGVTAEEMKEMQWLRPKLVAQVRVSWNGPPMVIYVTQPFWASGGTKGPTRFVDRRELVDVALGRSEDGAKRQTRRHACSDLRAA